MTAPESRHPLAWAEMELFENGQVVVDDEDFAFELLRRAMGNRVTGRVEPTGDYFRVTVSSRPPLAIDSSDRAVRRIDELTVRPSPVLQVLP